jgi:hypothetical protein
LQALSEAEWNALCPVLLDLAIVQKAASIIMGLSASFSRAPANTGFRALRSVDNPPNCRSG